MERVYNLRRERGLISSPSSPLSLVGTRDPEVFTGGLEVEKNWGFFLIVGTEIHPIIYDGVVTNSVRGLLSP